MGYYQGLSFVAIFIYHQFNKDKLKTYRFLHFSCKKFFASKFTKNFKGMIELIFLTDKLLQIHQPEIWSAYQKANISSLYFASSSFITVFSIGFDEQKSKNMIFLAWDLLLGGGFKELLRMVNFLLGIQKDAILNCKVDDLMLLQSGFDKNPFAMSEKSPLISGEILLNIKSKMSKSNIRQSIKIKEHEFSRLVSHFYDIHYPIFEFWNPNLSQA